MIFGQLRFCRVNYRRRWYIVPLPLINKWQTRTFGTVPLCKGGHVKEPTEKTLLFGGNPWSVVSFFPGTEGDEKAPINRFNQSLLQWALCELEVHVSKLSISSALFQVRVKIDRQFLMDVFACNVRLFDIFCNQLDVYTYTNRFSTFLQVCRTNIFCGQCCILWESNYTHLLPPLATTPSIGRATNVGSCTQATRWPRLSGSGKKFFMAVTASQQRGQTFLATATLSQKTVLLESQ